MTHKERILKLLDEIIGSICDDCLALKLGLNQRQTANQICNNLASNNKIERKKSICIVCKKYKLSNRVIGKIGSLAITKEKTPPDIKSSKRPWYWEGNIQSSLISWLVLEGYSIQSAANTKAHTKGKDIIAINLAKQKIWISVKGYPEKSLHTQARHWFSEAIFDLLLYRNESSSVILALGMPDGFTTYLNLAARMDWLFKVLPFKIFVISEPGEIRIQENT